MSLVTFDRTDGGATFGEWGLGSDYRYRLWRRVGPGHQRVGFVMLNPSTADDQADDPTIRRCIAFARAWGFGILEVGNIFALRSTDPKRLYISAGPIGEHDDDQLARLARRCEFVVAAWGAHGALHNRGAEVRRLLGSVGADVRALKLTKDGHPGHPLYLPAKSSPIRWPEPAEKILSRNTERNSRSPEDSRTVEEGM